MPKNNIIAIAGAGDVAKFLVEELLKSKYTVVVLSRAVRPWFDRPDIDLRVTDYSVSSIRGILDATEASVLFSFIHDNSSLYNTLHEAMLQACVESKNCKRFIPSECGGDLDKHADKPRFYIPTHGAFREVLKKQNEIEWTLLNGGWFMDYFVPAKKSYMKSIVPVWPLDLDRWSIVIPGTGDEPVGFTAARDVAKACVKLVEAENWDPITYVLGENSTWNEIVGLVQEFHGKTLDVSYYAASRTQEDLEKYKDTTDQKEIRILWKGYMDEWNYSGASSLPVDKVLMQRSKYFPEIKFRKIRELLEDGENPAIEIV